MLHRPPSTQASNAPLDSPGVSNPPCVPARNVLQVIATFATSNNAANSMVIWLSKLICAGPLPLPSNCGNPPARKPITAKLIRLKRISLALRGACALALLVRRVKKNAATPKIGPITADHTSNDGVIASGIRWYCDSLPRPIHATSAAIAEVQIAGNSSCQLNAPNSTSSTNTAPPSGTLYTAASPAPAPQAIMICVSRTVREKRCDSQLALTAPISRGATSRPNGEPSATVIICSSAWIVVLKNGVFGLSDLTAAAMLTKGLPQRYSAHQPRPATRPQATNTAKRRRWLAAVTPSRKLSLLITASWL